MEVMSYLPWLVPSFIAAQRQQIYGSENIWIFSVLKGWPSFKKSIVPQDMREAVLSASVLSLQQPSGSLNVHPRLQESIQVSVKFN